MTTTVGFIGLGVMGYPMASHLLRSGFDVQVYNRDRSKAERLAAGSSARVAATPAEAARSAEFVMACVGDDLSVRSVVLGEHGAFAGMSPGSVFIDHTTASAGLARELAAEAQARGLAFLDAPVSGGQAGAESGSLTVMAGGDAEGFRRAETVMASYGRSLNYMGEAGSGQLTKMVNQICIAGVLQGLAEGLHFATQAGLDGDRVVGAISGGAAQSWQMNNRAQTMLAGKFDFGFAVDWMRKDLGIALGEARRNGAQLPLTALVDQFYADVQKMGGERWDTSSLIARLQQ